MNGFASARIMTWVANEILIDTVMQFLFSPCCDFGAKKAEIIVQVIYYFGKTTYIRVFIISVTVCLGLTANV